MINKYPLLNEPGKTMFVFEKLGKVYGHIIKNPTAKDPAKLVHETGRFDSIDQLKAEFPPQPQ